MSKTKKVLLSVVALAAASSAYAEDTSKSKAVKKVHKETKVAEEPKVEHKHHHHHSDVKVTLGASMDVQYGAVSESGRFGNIWPDGTTVHILPRREQGLANDTLVTVGIEGMSRGLKYGGKIVLNADTSNSKTNNNRIAQQTSVYVESMFGRVEAGSMNGATVTMTADPRANGTGGAAHGDWRYWINPNWTSATTSTTTAYMYTANTFLLSANQVTDYQPTDTSGNGILNNYANKLSYFSPSWMGATLGVSYVPDTDVVGTAAILATTAGRYMKYGQYPDVENVESGASALLANNAANQYGTPLQGFRNVVAGGLNYANAFGKFDVKASVLGQTGTAKAFYTLDNATASAIARKDLSSYELAASLGFMGWTLGGSYGDFGDSGQVALATLSGQAHSALSGNVSTYYYTGFLGYEYGPLNVAAQYFQSQQGGVIPSTAEGSEVETGRNKATVWSLGVDYKLAQGLLPYVEYTSYKLQQNRTLTDATTIYANTGGVFLVGTKLFF